MGVLRFATVDCPICLEPSKPGVLHPACARHELCVGCFREGMYPEEPPSVSAKEYGFATDCECAYCAGQDVRWDYCPDALNVWKEQFPDLYNVFDAARNKRLEDFDKQIDTRVDWRVCPVCRASMD